ncbi:MAG: glutaredoxin family protein [Chthoniobacterales bacterium]
MMKLYVKIWCPWCVAAIDWLRKNDFEFEMIDVLADSKAFQKMRDISGQSKTPTLELDDGSVLPDFDTKQLEKFLKQHSLLN